jgi:hypothetical protein
VPLFSLEKTTHFRFVAVRLDGSARLFLYAQDTPVATIAEKEADFQLSDLPAEILHDHDNAHVSYLFVGEVSGRVWEKQTAHINCNRLISLKLI